MSDFGGLLASDFGLKPQGKSAPMASSKGSSRSSRTSNNPLGAASSIDDYDSIFGSSANNRKSHDVDSLDGFADVFGGPPKYTATSESRGGGGGGDSGFNFDSMMYGGSSTDSGAAKSSSLPKYDKPVYDDDIFDGVPGLKSSSTVKYDDVFASVVSPPKSTGFDDLLGSLSGSGSESKSSRVKGSERVEKGVDSFDDLLGGFGSSPRIPRQTSEASRSSKSTVDATRTTPKMMEEPFVVLESASPPEVSSPRPFTDPLEETNKFNVSGGTQFDVSSVKGRLVDDMDPLGGLGKSVPAFSSEISDRGKDRSFLRKGPSTSGRHTPDSKESIDRSSVRSPDNQSERKRPGSNYPESHQTMFAPTVSNSFHDTVGQTASPPSYVDPGHNVMNSQADMSPTSEDNMESSDDLWLTVSEIPLFTQPTSAPPPSRPPPPRPAKVSRADMGSFASRNARKTVNDFSSVPNSSQYFESSKSVPSARGPVVSQIDQLEDFAMGRTRTNINEHVDGFSGHEVETNSDAAASAAAMKDAMDRAEAKFRHAKEVRERENAKAARSREAVQLEKDEKATEDRTPREKREEELREERRIEEERERTREFEREREEKEREQRKLEKERERARETEREREKARQAVERATREARDRAAVDARLKQEKFAVEKVNAEARQRAERAAVQRAQAEARERAAADAKERAEKVAAEARERTNAEAKERAARAEVDARNRAERAAVERASAEARQRAAAEARDRAAAAAAAAKVNQQKNEDDLESFFGMGARPSSVPKARANSSDPLFDTQFQTRTGPEVARRTSVGTSSSMRKASSTTNIADDLSSIFGAVPSSGDFQEMEGETEERRRARLERHQRTQERAANALAEKNQRDLQVQRDQAERNRIGETLDAEIKRWSAGKEGNLRALLSTLQYVLWPECGWQPVSLTDLINAASVKKVYRKATLCIHPDKVQQKGANLQQKYVAEKVFDLLKEAWNKFNSEELF